jgi:hypothetical protein
VLTGENRESGFHKGEEDKPFLDKLKSKKRYAYNNEGTSFLHLSL